MKFLKKLLIFAIVVAVLVVGFKAFTKPKNIEIGKLHKGFGQEVVLLDVEVSDKVYVNGNERSDDFYLLLNLAQMTASSVLLTKTSVLW